MTEGKLLIVGGFLGAGKTTLLAAAAEHLKKRGLKAGLITNDQAPDLVDTAWLSRSGVAVREVAGSCFCCNFPGFASAVDALLADGADVILAEPVGSCTDLSATILQPVKALRPGVRLAPFSVVLDPRRALEALSLAEPTLHPDALYILRLQLAEADVILLNKADTLSTGERDAVLDSLRKSYPASRVQPVSALKDTGVDEWLDAMLAAGAGYSGLNIVEVDYDRYANGEAVLGWLNMAATPVWKDVIDGETYLRRFFESLQGKLKSAGARAGHVKLLCAFPDGTYIGNMTDRDAGFSVRRADDPDASLADTFIVNARVECAPEQLERVILAALNEAGGDRVALTPRGGHCLKPGRPTPTYRYSKVV